MVKLNYFFPFFLPKLFFAYIKLVFMNTNDFNYQENDFMDVFLTKI